MSRVAQCVYPKRRHLLRRSASTTSAHFQSAEPRAGQCGAGPSGHAWRGSAVRCVERAKEDDWQQPSAGLCVPSHV